MAMKKEPPFVLKANIGKPKYPLSYKASVHVRINMQITGSDRIGKGHPQNCSACKPGKDSPRAARFIELRLRPFIASHSSRESPVGAFHRVVIEWFQLRQGVFPSVVSGRNLGLVC